MNDIDNTSWEVEICAIEGGRLPERKSEGAIGFDVYARAIVSKDEMDPHNPNLRKTLFDFETVPASASLQEHIVPDPDQPGKWAYLMRPGDQALVGVGFTTALPEKLLYWLTPRSGLSLEGIGVLNAPGTVDPDYRGEAGILLFNRSPGGFLLQLHSRIAQAVFAPVALPTFVIKSSIEDLGSTQRGAGGFGSTGLLD